MEEGTIAQAEEKKDVKEESEEISEKDETPKPE